MINSYTLHYFFDPFCGWCYGAAPLLHQIKLLQNDFAETDTPLQIRLHPGGMFSNHNRLQISPQFRAMATSHDARIADITGQIFSDTYKQELLLDTRRILDSTPPSAAIIAAEYVAGRGLAMLHSLQQAHYISGLDITAETVLLQQAKKLQLDQEVFNDSLIIAHKQINTVIDDSREKMLRFNLMGFPAFVLESSPHLQNCQPAGLTPNTESSFKALNHKPFYGQPTAFADYLKQLT